MSEELNNNETQSTMDKQRIKAIRETGKLTLYRSLEDEDGFEAQVGKPSPFFRLGFTRVKQEYLKKSEQINKKFPELTSRVKEQNLIIINTLISVIKESGVDDETANKIFELISKKIEGKIVFTITDNPELYIQNEQMIDEVKELEDWVQTAWLRVLINQSKLSQEDAELVKLKEDSEFWKLQDTREVKAAVIYFRQAYGI